MFYSNRRRSISQIILVYICSINLISNTAYAATLHVDEKSNNDLSGGSKANVCISPVCQKEASYLLSLMNQTVDPCNDFYQFTCGKFISNPDIKIPEGKEFIYSFNDIQEKVDKELLKEFEEIKKDDSDSMKKLKIYFANCRKKVGQESVDDLKKIINSAGGMPLLSRDKWNESSFNYTEAVLNLRTYGVTAEFPAMFSIVVDKENNTKNIIRLIFPETGIKKDFFDSENKKLHEYYDSMISKMVKLGADLDLAKKEMKDCLDFEVELYNVKSPLEFLRNTTATYNPMTIKELRQMVPNIPWLYYFKRIFSLVNITLNENEVIVVVDPAALRKVGKLLERTPKRVIANYLMWQVIRASFDLLPDEYTGKTTGDKTFYCVERAKRSVALAAGALYAQKFASPKIKKEATELVDYIKNDFRKVLLEADWIDEKTKEAALIKAAEMKLWIGYPNEFLDNKIIDDYYQGFKLDHGSFLRSVFNISAFNLRNLEISLRESTSKNDWTSRSEETIINAHYFPFKNSLELQTAILQSPFFNAKRPHYLNYGNLGKIIGHEIMHGFDNIGRKYDKTGAYRNWWEPSTEKQYDKKAQCFVSQYCNYTINEVGLQVDGTRTLRENIADTVGIKLAYHAYTDWMNHNNVIEPQLPGLNYTPKQMFWISGASFYCKKQTLLSLKNDISSETHSPHEARVNIPRWNSQEFANDFQCAPGSRMNPVEKCILW